MYVNIVRSSGQKINLVIISEDDHGYWDITVAGTNSCLNCSLEFAEFQ